MALLLTTGSVASPLDAIPLQGGDPAPGSRECVIHPGEHAATAGLWRDAREAIQGVVSARARGIVRHEALLHDRRLDPNTLEVREEESERHFGFGAIPLGGPGVEALAAGGFVQHTDSGTSYFGPDEAVLLSDEFLERHCFRVHRSERRPELVGLAFEPVGETDRVDVEGVLWLDAGSRELRLLEFRYANLDLDVPTDQLGGEVRFQRLGTGEWIRRRWWIRMPETELRTTRVTGLDADRPVLTALRERGGEIVAIETGGGGMEDLDRPRLEGVVYDSVRGRPLSGAHVFLVGTDHRARTDGRGRFSLTVGEGTFLLGFTHPRLDSLGVQPPPRSVTLRAGAVHQVRLALPSEATLVAAVCGASLVEGMVRGTVTGADGQALPDARVLLAWRSAGGQVVRREAAAGGQGAFLFCDVPPSTPVFLRALHEGAATDPLPLTVGRSGMVSAELRVRPRRGRVTGRLTDAVTGRPIADVALRIAGTGIRALSDAGGRFLLEGVPATRQVLEVSHLAYGTHTDSLRVQPDSTVSVHLLLTQDAIAVEPIRVTAPSRPVAGGLAGYYERLGQGTGYFVTAEQIERRQSRQLSEVLRAVPGLMVSCSSSSVLGSGCVITFERSRAMDPRGGERDCPVQYFLDGSSASREIIEAVRPESIEGIEVYNGVADVPPRFQRGRDTRCGVIAVWLKTSR